MTEDTTKPGLDEKYARAINSTDLRMVDDRQGSADLLAAFGISAGLGALLQRLRAEFDSVKGEHGLADAEFERVRQVIRGKLADAQREQRRADMGPTRAALFYAEAEALRIESERAGLTATALTMMHLKTLREAKNALAAYALNMATRRRHMIPDREVVALTGHALGVWLDDRCRKCAGTGAVGEFGRRRLTCRACGGTGNASHGLGQNADQVRFCADLLRDMGDKSGHGVARDVRINRKAVKLGKEKIAEALANA